MDNAISVKDGDIGSSAYLDFLTKLREKWTDAPDVYIHFDKLAYTLSVPKKSNDVPTLFTAVTGIVKRCIPGQNESSNKFKKLAALAPATGVIRPGSMTIVLAPPGHGKTTLLQALSNRLNDDPHLTGTIRYNGLTPSQASERGIYVHRLASYIGQNDLHFPTLTVSETLTFSATNSNSDITLLEDHELTSLDSKRAEMMMEMIGLTECKDTVIGNNLLRGVSGGQRRRVTVAEMLITNARVFMLDEPTTGLDAAVAYHLFDSLKQFARIGHTSIVSSLLQPSPELYGLFDDVILMREGVIVYHGARKDVSKWFSECVGVDIPKDVDEAAWIVDFLLDPESTEKLTRERLAMASPSQKKRIISDPVKNNNNNNNNDKGVEEERKSTEDHLTPMTTKLFDGSTPSPSPSSSQSHQDNHTPTHTHTQAQAQAQAPTHTHSQAESQQIHTVVFHLPAADDEDRWDTPIPNHTNNNNNKMAIELTPLVKEDIQMASHTRSRKVALSTQEILAAFEDSPFFDKLSDEYSNSLKQCEEAQSSSSSSMKKQSSSSSVLRLSAEDWSPYTRAQFASKYPRSWRGHTVLNLIRQGKLISRNRTMVVPRIFQSILMGFIYSTLFFQLSLDDFQSKFGLMLYVVMFGAFANLTELPVSAEAKNVVSKQLESGFYPTTSYILSCVVVNIPLMMTETLIFGTLMYWVSDFTPDAGRYFFFLLIMLLSGTAMSTFFRSISYVASNPDIARQMDLPFIVIFVMFGGFMIAYSKIPNWLIWLFWLSPFSWAVRSMAINEFGAPRYDGPGQSFNCTTYTNTSINHHVSGGGSNSIPDYTSYQFMPTKVFESSVNVSSSLFNNSYNTCSELPYERPGWLYMDAFSTWHDWAYKWSAIAYLVGFFITFSIISTYFLSKAKPVQPLGTKRLSKEEREEEGDHGFSTDSDGEALKKHQTSTNNHNNNSSSDGKEPLAIRVRQANQRASMNSLPFEPMTLAWRHIHYTVYVGKDGKEARKLLNDINGYAKPGTLTALMGASGAGKTTLMDLIAGRKTVGKIEGEITVNGHPKDPATYGFLSGYVEQNDIHIGTATVREALMFSAKLRLPVSVTTDQRVRFVSEVMDLVGLTPIADRMIGDEALPGLSPGQLKLVTIGVELVANPSILFLDEPTSGLDAPAAYKVMKAVRRIAGTGRTVLCTIHQPSQQLFEMFDRLLLLKTGGEEVYFADLGKHSAQLVDYFENQTSSDNDKHALPPPRLPVGQNPANWMLDVIGAAGGNRNINYAQIWREHPYKQQAGREVDALMTPPSNSAPYAPKHNFVSTWTRYWEVQYRYFQSHWRNPPMNLTRALLMLINGLLLGIVYLHIDRSDFAGTSSFLAVIFLGISFPAAVSASSASPALFRQRAVYYREKTINMYGYAIYSTAMGIVELPYIFISIAVFFAIPFYFLVGLANDANLFFKFVFACYTQALVNSCLTQVFIAAMPNAIASNVVAGLFTSLFFMFGGLFKHPNVIPPGWKWFYYVDPVPKTFVAAALPQMWCDTSACGPATKDSICPCPKIFNPANSQWMYSYDYAVSIMEFSADDYWPMIGYLYLTILGLRLINLLALRFISHIKR